MLRLAVDLRKPSLLIAYLANHFRDGIVVGEVPGDSRRVASGARVKSSVVANLVPALGDGPPSGQPAVRHVDQKEGSFEAKLVERRHNVHHLGWQAIVIGENHCGRRATGPRKTLAPVTHRRCNSNGNRSSTKS